MIMPKTDELKIKSNTKYRIKGNSQYFKNKYNTSNPIITIEGEHKAIGFKWWGSEVGNPACMLYGIRSAHDHVPLDNPLKEEVYYGKISGMGELVHMSELEEITA